MTTSSLFLAAALAVASATSDAPVVEVQSGKVRGTVASEVASYKGIPYAAPPVGDLRWRPPAPAPKWKGIRPAAAAGPMCIQSFSIEVIPEAAQSEDCLTLNIWAPANRPKEPLPVMVWVHGGAFFLGSGSLPLYDGTHFARDGVVLVTLNYRLGRLGFFAHPALGRAEGEVEGNYGLLDQVAALKWVQNNIGAFGGDPANVTLFGESAGALSINYLLASQKTEGLFKRAIVMSGFSRTPAAPIRGEVPAGARTGEAIGIEVARQLGIEGVGLDAAVRLRALRARALAPPLEITNPLLPGPMIDGELVWESIASAFRANRQQRVDLMTGGVSWEASIFDHLRPALPMMLAMTGDPAKTRSLLDPGGMVDTDAIADRLVTHSAGTEANRFQARQVARAGNCAFLYHFDYVPQVRREEWPGTPHAGELSYLFGTLRDEPYSQFLVNLPAATPADRAYGDAMRRYWIAFARDGVPRAPGGTSWLPFTVEDDRTLVFANNGPRLVDSFEKPLLDWFESVAEAAAKK